MYVCTFVCMYVCVYVYLFGWFDCMHVDMYNTLGIVYPTFVHTYKYPYTDIIHISALNCQKQIPTNFFYGSNE